MKVVLLVNKLISNNLNVLSLPPAETSRSVAVGPAISLAAQLELLLCGACLELLELKSSLGLELVLPLIVQQPGSLRVVNNFFGPRHAGHPPCAAWSLRS
eukprot:g51555.t1